MNSATNITLTTLTKPHENEAVTIHSDGSTLSQIFDLKWDFSGMEQGSVGSRSSVSFKEIDIAYRQDIQITLAYIMKAFKKKNKSYPSRSQVNNWKLGLTHLAEVIGSSHWGDLSDDVRYKRFLINIKKLIQRRNLSVTAVSNIITVINKLNEVGLCVRVPDGNKLRSMACKDVEQHIAIPIGIYQKIIKHALDVVEALHPHRHSICELQRRAEDENSLTLHQSNDVEHEVPNFKVSRNGSSINDILKACAIVVLAFSGMRVGEVISLSKYSFKEKGGSKIPVLTGEETKRNGKVVQEVWQTHTVVKDALELAFDATQYLRDVYKAKNDESFELGGISKEKYSRSSRQLASSFLVARQSVNQLNFVQTNMSRLLNGFVQKLGIVATQSEVDEFNRLNPSREGQLKVGGTLPKLTPHDFRRSFAVFFKRYGFGSSSTIKFQYKHANIQMSDYYGNNARLQAMEDVLLDNDLLKLMNEEGIQMGVDIFDEIYNESEHLGGAGGERIAKDKFERLSSGEHVYMTRSEIERLVRNGTLSVVKLPTGGYCTNTTCSRVCGIGEFAAEIKPCEHEVITDKQAKIILKQNKRLIKAFREMNTGDPMMNSILIGQKQKIQRNEQKIKDFNLTFEPFTDKVKGTIETVEA